MFYRAELLWNVFSHKPQLTPLYNATQVAYGENEADVVKEVRRRLAVNKGADKAQVYEYESPQSQAGQFIRYYEVTR